MVITAVAASLAAITLTLCASLAVKYAAPRPALIRGLHIGGADMMIAGCAVTVVAFLAGVYGEHFSRALETT